MSSIAYEVFISSAMYELASEREMIREVIEELNMQPGMFELLPAMSKSLEEAYLDKVDACEFFILVMGREIRAAVREEYQRALKTGKPIVIFVKRIIHTRKGEEDPSTAELLEKLYEMPVSDIRNIPLVEDFSTLKELKVKIKHAILNELSLQATQIPRTARTKKDLYKLATQIVGSAKRRVYVFQRTPTLLLGARPYLEANKIFYEKEFLEVLEAWIKQALGDKSRDFMYLFSDKAMASEIGDDARLKKRVQDKLREYKKVEIESEYRLRFSCPRAEFSGPIAIGDDRFSLWITGDNDAVFLSFQNKRLTDELVNVFEQFASELMSADQLVSRCVCDVSKDA